MVKMRKDALLSIVVLCTVFLATHLVESDIVIKKERTRRSLSDKLLKNNDRPQLISKEDENIVRKRSAFSELIKDNKIRNTPYESTAKKNTTQESISEPETREPVSKDYEAISPVVDTFEEYKEDYGIFHETSESEKLGRFIRHLTSLGRLQRRKKQAPPDPATVTEEASNQPTTSTGDTTVTSATSDVSASILSDCTGETQATSQSEASGGTEETGLSEVTEDSQGTGQTGTSSATEVTEQSGESEDTQATGESGSPEDTKATHETALTGDTEATDQSTKLIAEGPAGGTKEPSTFIIDLEQYTVPDDLYSTGSDSISAINEDTETGSDTIGTINEETETNGAEAEFRAAIPAGGSDSIGAINEDTEIGGVASDVDSSLIVDPSKARIDRVAYHQESSGIANSDMAGLDGVAYDEDTSVIQGPDSIPLLKKTSRDLHLRKDYEDEIKSQTPKNDFEGKAIFYRSGKREDAPREKHFVPLTEYGNLKSILSRNKAFRLNPFRSKIQYEESQSNAEASNPVSKVKLEGSHRWKNENRTIHQRNFSGRDAIGRINEDKESDGVANEENSSLIEDPNIARSDRVAIDEESSLIEDTNIARSEGIVIDEDSSLIKDQNIGRSDGMAIDEDSSLIEDPNIARSDEEVSDEDSSLILDLDMADAIRLEDKSSKSSEDLRYRKDGDVPNRPRRPAIAHVRRKDIILTWSPPKTSDGPPAEGYLVEMRDEDGDYKAIGKPATPYLEVSKLTPGKTYFLKIKSRNESGASEPLILKYFMDDEIPAESGEDEEGVSSEEKPEAYIVGEKEGEDILVTDPPS